MDSKESDLSENSKSPILPNSRKRTIETIEDGLKIGKFKEIESCQAFYAIVDESGLKIDRMRCKVCRKIISSGPGGHKTEHRNGKCLKSKRTRILTSPEKDELKEAISTYIIESGESFNQCESENFRNFVKATMSAIDKTIDPTSWSMPCSETLRELVDIRCGEILQKIASEIREPIVNGEACLILDYGKHLHDFLSSHVVYIDRSSGISKIRAIPFTFLPVMESKSADSTFQYLKEAAENFGLSENALKNMRLVGDGASSIQKLGKQFRSYSKCSCHVIQKIAERTLAPLETLKHNFSSSELDRIRDLADAFDVCGSIAGRLHRMKRSLKIDKVPPLSVPTRWLTFLDCAKAVVSTFLDLEQLKDTVIQNLANDLRPHLGNLHSAFRILEKFVQPLKRLEQSEVRINEVAPLLYRLQTFFLSQQQTANEAQDPVLEALAKSAYLATSHYIQNTIMDVHLIGTFLSPSMRNLKAFPKSVQEQTLKIVKRELELVGDEETIGCDETPEPSKLDDLFDFHELAEEKSDGASEIDIYLSTYVPASEREDVLEFWNKNRFRFPRLYRLSSSIFCVLASETISERSFSHLKKVFRPDRFRLEPAFVEKLMISYMYTNKYC